MGDAWSTRVRVEVEAEVAGSTEGEPVAALLAQALHGAGFDSVQVYGLGQSTVTVQLAPEVITPDGDVTQETARLESVLAAIPGVRRVTALGPTDGHPVYERACRVDGKRFYARKPTTDICYAHWYAGELDAARAEHAPLIEAIKAATGLDSEVWQTGGMTMNLATLLDPADPDGPCYVTLVEEVTETGWAGGTSFYPHGMDAGGDEDEQDVVFDFVGELTPQAWAQRIAEHYASLRPMGEVQEQPQE